MNFKDTEKIDIYQDLAEDWKKLWNMPVVIHVVMVALGTSLRNLKTC